MRIIRRRFTCGKPKADRQATKAHKRACRRAYRQYLRTGDVRDLNRSERVLDFD
jgi:hypothetical protein